MSKLSDETITQEVTRGVAVPQSYALKLAYEVRAVEQQRDELLEALVAAEDAGLFDLLTSHLAGINDKYRHAIRALITKVKGSL